MTHYEKCPNGCDGEVPLEWDNEAQSAVIDDDANATSHDPECPPLTEAQREAIMDAATLVMSDPGYWAERFCERWSS